MYVSEDNQVKKQNIVAKIDFTKNGFEDVTENYNLNFGIDSLDFTNKGNDYTFTVNTNYFWNMKYKWYIYRNGAFYDNESDDEVLDYTFSEPGEYTVSFYVTTPNGDREYWNYPIIEIK